MFAAAQAMYIDFNGSGVRCDLSQLQRHLPVQFQHLFTLKEVMRYLASQKRKSLGLGTDAIVLQVITIDELQLVAGQSEVLQNKLRKLVDVLIGNLAGWMISGNWHVHQHEVFPTALQSLFSASRVSLLTLCSWKLTP